MTASNIPAVARTRARDVQPKRPGKVPDVQAIMHGYISPIRGVTERADKLIKAVGIDFEDRCERYVQADDAYRHSNDQRREIRRKRAASVLAELASHAPPEWVATAHETIRQAVATRADEREVRFLLAMGLEAFRTKSADGAQMLFEAAVFTVRDSDDPISGPVLAMAIREIWRSQRFAPSASEILAECTAKRSRLKTHERALERLMDLRTKLHAIAPPDPAPPALLGNGNSHRPQTNNATE